MAGGGTIWLTGLSGAGKSTLAHVLADALRSAGCQIEILDGDEIRQHLSAGLGFSREDRDTNIARIAYVAKLLARNGVLVIVAAISPYRAARDTARRTLGTFIEVYVSCDLEELIRRDVKGLYARALRGEIAHFTGISDPYEPPLQPEVVVLTDRDDVQTGVTAILERLRRDGWLAVAER